MKFRCDIDMSNAAFDENREFELCRILTMIVRQVREGQTAMGLKDSNGNRVGQWVFEGDDNG